MKQLFTTITLVMIIYLIPGIHPLSYGQGIKANPDNFFVSPIPSGGSSYSTYLDVLQNDFYSDDGSIGDLEVEVVEDPVKGYSWYDSNSYRLEYMPIDGEVGPDSLIYEVKSKLTNRTARATVYINLNDKPGVISDATCFVDPEGITFDIGLLAQSDPAQNVSSLSSIITGDIDNDGKVEMIVIGTPQGGNTTATNLYVYNYDPSEVGQYKLKLKYNIPITGWVNQWPSACFSIAKITGGTANIKSTASIFFANPIEKILYRYDLNGASYTETWRTPLNSNRLYSSVSPIIVDLMGNGRQQIVCADRIYDADTGELLVVATDISGTPLVSASGRSSYSFGCYGHYLTVVGIYESSIIAADIDGDGLPELVAGDCIYKVNIGDFTTNNTSLNTYRLYRRANYKTDLVTKWDAAHTEVGDGGTAIADIDNDGQLDVIISGTVGGTGAASTFACVYVYNPRTGKLLHDNIINDIPRNNTNYGPSRPFVGDIDGDGYSEIALTAHSTLRAYKMDFSTNTLVEMWRTTTTDTSASTTLSMFDFTQDGIARMIYRDITSLRIIRSTPTGSIDEYTFNTGTFSGTLNECPIVIDVDGDGHAEILATASPTSTWGYDGSLRIYAASGTAKWAPARSVWNQVAYNPVYVNDDLTIPRNPLSPATKFVSSDTIVRPFNNFLQQATSLNQNGLMIMEGADLTFSSRAPRRLSYEDNGDLTISVTVVNQGLVSFDYPIVLQLYSTLGDPAVYNKVGSSYSYPNSTGLSSRGERVLSYTIPNSQLPGDGSYDGWAISVNLKEDLGSSDNDYLYGKECRSWLNNRALGFNVLDGRTIACPGQQNVPVNAYPQNTYDIYWYNLSGSLLVGPADTYTLPEKDTAPVTKLLVRARNKISGTMVSNVPDTIYVYRAADSLVWTNSGGDQDWHNPLNWRKGGISNDPSPDSNIPLGCTKVTLLGGSGAYPDLLSTTSGGHTDYSEYGFPSCSNIRFNFGSQLDRSDLLSYDSVRVETRLESHRWYMYAPPLKQIYSGDFYINSPIPSKDILKSYTKSWGGIHPVWQSYIESQWTSIYSLPDVEYPLGHGLGIWISDNQDRDGEYFTFEFPKQDEKYHIYVEGTDSIDGYYPGMSTSRVHSHRFIYDGSGNNGSSFNLPVEGKEVGSLVFVGNPFMSHLDFDKFYAANSGKIKSEYKILNRNNNNYLYYRQGQVSTLTKDIAPMQGFLVEAISPFTSLTIDGTMTSVIVGSSLRQGQASFPSEDPGQSHRSHNVDLVLPVTIRQDGVSDVTYLVFGNTYQSHYNQDDVICLFDEKGGSSMVRPVSIYSLSSDGIKLNLQSLPWTSLTGNNRIGLGLRSPSSSPVTINVGNLGNLPSGVKLSLYDSRTGLTHSLSNQSMYSFTDITPGVDYFEDDRFHIHIDYNSTGVAEEPVQDNTVYAHSRSGHLHVRSQEDMQKLEVYSLDGRLLKSSVPVSKSYDVSLPVHNLYLVRIHTSRGVNLLKVLNR